MQTNLLRKPKVIRNGSCRQISTVSLCVRVCQSESESERSWKCFEGYLRTDTGSCTTRTGFHCGTVSGDFRLDSGFPVPRLEPVAASESFKILLATVVAQFTFPVTMATDAGEPR